MKNLPDKPSELLRLALDDLIKVEKSKKYTVDMYTWYRKNGKCTVCFAGAVMAKSLSKVTKELGRKEVIPLYFDYDIGSKLEALNEFRQGAIGSAYRALNREKPKFLAGYAAITDYGVSPKEFKRDIRDLIRVLELFGQ